MTTPKAWARQNQQNASAANDLPRDRQVRTTDNANMPEGLADRIVCVLRYNDWELSPEAVELRFGVKFCTVRAMLKRRGLLDQYVGDHGWLEDFNRRLDAALDRYEAKYGTPGRSRHAQWGYGRPQFTAHGRVA